MLTIGLVVWGVVASLLAVAFGLAAQVRGVGVRRLRALLDEQVQAVAVAHEARDEARRNAEAAGLACTLAAELAAAEGERERVLAGVPRGTVRLREDDAE